MAVPNEAIYLGPPPPGPVPLPAAPTGYLGVFTAIHRFPNWFVSSLLCGVCGFIPVVGVIVFIGYTMENVESLHRSNGQRFVPFDFNRFVDYLVRGLGPWLVLLIALVVIYVLGYAIELLMGWQLDLTPFWEALRQPNATINVMEVGTPILVYVVRSNVIAYSMLFAMQPLIFALSLRGGLTRELKESFRLAPAVKIVRTTASAVWMTSLLYAAIALPLYLFAFLTCGIAAIFADGYLRLVNAWFCYQLYRRHLALGGEPIPLPSAAVAAEVL